MRSLVIIALSLCSIYCSASDHPKITAEPLWKYAIRPDDTRRPDLKNVNDGYFLDLLDRQVNVTSKTTYTHFIRHIINETGVQNGSEVSISFSPAYETLVFHKITVIRNGVAVNHLSAKAIKTIQEETSATQFEYNGINRAFVVLKDIRKDDRIDVAYSIIGFNPVYGNAYSAAIYFSANNSVTNYFETIITEPNRHLNFTCFNDAAMPVEQEIDGKKIYTWTNPKVKIWTTDSGTPSWYYPYPYVVATEYKNWMEVIKWGIGICDNYQYTLPAALEKKIATWKLRAHGDNDEFISQAIRYVQDDIRYLGIEEGVHTHKPHAPSDVYAKGYGDCKDKALLLVSILRHENIEAFLSLVNTTTKGEMYKSAATPIAFDHAIVAIERPDDYQYVDATKTNQRGELSELFVPAYGYALLLKTGETGLRAMQPGPLNSTYITETLNVDFNDTSTLSVYTAYKGGRADAIREYFNETGMKDMQDSYMSYYAPLYDGIEVNGDFEHRDDTVANTFIVEEAYDIPSLWKDDDKHNKSFSVYAKQIFQDFPDPSSATRSAPLALRHPSTTQYVLKLQMPETWSFPEDELHIKNESYQFDFEVTLAGSLITLKYFLKTFKDHIPANETDQYRKDYKKIRDIIEYSVSYKQPSLMTGNERLRPYWPAIWTSVLILAALSIIFIRLDRRTIDVEYERHSGLQIGGWMVVVGITLAISVIFGFYSLFINDFFTAAAWIARKERGFDVAVVAMLELAFIVLKFCAACAVLYWFMKKRDIFPQMFLAYASLLVVTDFILLVVYSAIPSLASSGNIVHEQLVQVFRVLVYGGIWCTYIAKASRTKVTFLKGRS